jgi:membrane-bound inhibitor of C-type lysozyme
MTRSTLAALVAAALLTPAIGHAAEATLQVELGTKGDFERRAMTYECNDGSSVTATYINAAPNFLAILPVIDEPEPLVFTSVVAGSGVRYVSGIWEWWTKGVDATLHDVTLGQDAEPVLTCSEVNNTP